MFSCPKSYDNFFSKIISHLFRQENNGVPFKSVGGARFRKSQLDSQVFHMTIMGCQVKIRCWTMWAKSYMISHWVDLSHACLSLIPTLVCFAHFSGIWSNHDSHPINHHNVKSYDKSVIPGCMVGCLARDLIEKRS